MQLKKLIIILLITISGYSQSVDGVKFDDLKGLIQINIISDLSGGSVKFKVDIGKERLKKVSKITSKEGAELAFRSPIRIVNYFREQGWELVDFSSSSIGSGFMKNYNYIMIRRWLKKKYLQV